MTVYCDTSFLVSLLKEVDAILPSIHPDVPGYVYFTSIRPAHYRVYSQRHERPAAIDRDPRRPISALRVKSTHRNCRFNLAPTSPWVEAAVHSRKSMG
jgi:hypothetical protein